MSSPSSSSAGIFNATLVTVGRGATGFDATGEAIFAVETRRAVDGLVTNLTAFFVAAGGGGAGLVNTGVGFTTDFGFTATDLTAGDAFAAFVGSLIGGAELAVLVLPAGFGCAFTTGLAATDRFDAFLPAPAAGLAAGLGLVLEADFFVPFATANFFGAGLVKRDFFLADGFMGTESFASDGVVGAANGGERRPKAGGLATVLSAGSRAAMGCPDPIEVSATNDQLPPTIKDRSGALIG